MELKNGSHDSLTMANDTWIPLRIRHLLKLSHTAKPRKLNLEPGFHVKVLKTGNSIKHKTFPIDHPKLLIIKYLVIKKF
jgi:hypothetical protein